VLKSEPTSKNLVKPQTATEESSRTNFDLEKIPAGLCGLENTGNTCYMNSTLQCLSNIPPLSRFITNNQIPKLINSKNPAGTGGRVALTYSSLIQEMWSGKIENCTPTALKQRIDRYTTQFTEHDQHDSQEFMGFLLDALHEDLLYTQNVGSPITELFQGRLETTIHCETGCEPVSIPSTFTFLPLPIPVEKNTTDIYECMKDFLEIEAIGKHGKWYCNLCNQKTNAWKSVSIKRLPPVLILQLKRFNTLPTSPTKHANNNKIQTFVDYPIKNLDPCNLVPNLISADRYNLVAVSVHRGTLTSGHYTTIAKNRKNNLWYHFDDSIVTLASENEVRTKNAYILCYVRRGMEELPIKVPY
jgi:ubiquitin carboxyl-terminal hydrolase 8